LYILSNTNNILNSDNMTTEHIESEQIPQLTQLQRKVVLNLADKGFMSGYDFHLAGKRERGSRKAIMSSGYWEKTKRIRKPKPAETRETVRTFRKYLHVYEMLKIGYEESKKRIRVWRDVES
jgi:hypothetical protein